MTQFESRLNFNDSVYLDFYHSGGAGNGTVVAVKFDQSGKVFYDVKFAIIPPPGEPLQELVNMNYSTILRNVDGDLVKKIEYEHAHADLKPVNSDNLQPMSNPVEDTIQDAEVIE